MLNFQIQLCPFLCPLSLFGRLFGVSSANPKVRSWPSASQHELLPSVSDSFGQFSRLFHSVADNRLLHPSYICTPNHGTTASQNEGSNRVQFSGLWLCAPSCPCHWEWCSHLSKNLLRRAHYHGTISRLILEIYEKRESFLKCCLEQPSTLSDIEKSLAAFKKPFSRSKFLYSFFDLSATFRRDVSVLKEHLKQTFSSRYTNFWTRSQQDWRKTRNGSSVRELQRKFFDQLLRNLQKTFHISKKPTLLWLFMVMITATQTKLFFEGVCYKTLFILTHENVNFFKPPGNDCRVKTSWSGGRSCDGIVPFFVNQRDNSFSLMDTT